jgi:hypothetical protein
VLVVHNAINREKWTLKLNISNRKRFLSQKTKFMSNCLNDHYFSNQELKEGRRKGEGNAKQADNKRNESDLFPVRVIKS